MILLLLDARKIIFHDFCTDHRFRIGHINSSSHSIIRTVAKFAGESGSATALRWTLRSTRWRSKRVPPWTTANQNRDRRNTAPTTTTTTTRRRVQIQSSFAVCCSPQPPTAILSTSAFGASSFTARPRPAFSAVKYVSNHLYALEIFFFSSESGNWDCYYAVCFGSMLLHYRFPCFYNARTLILFITVLILFWMHDKCCFYGVLFQINRCICFLIYFVIVLYL